MERVSDRLAICDKLLLTNTPQESEYILTVDEDVLITSTPQYERLLDEHRLLCLKLKEANADFVRSPPKEARPIYAETPVAEPMAIVDEDRRPSGSPPKANRQSIFQLSPVPATIPIPSISSIHATFHSPAEDSDAEEVRKISVRSAQPIPIKSNGHHRHGSLLHRNDSDTVPRSIPRSIADVHMASCSSSPAVSDLKHSQAERPSETVSQSVTMHDSSMLSRRPVVSSRRPSVSTNNYNPDPERERLIFKQQLHELLDTAPSDNEAPRPLVSQIERKPPPRTMSPPRQVPPPRRTTSPETRRSTSPETSAPATRQPSPVSSGASDPVAEKEKIVNALLQRPKEIISRASTAAMQAEQARERSRTDKLVQSPALAPPPHQPSASEYKGSGLQRDISNTYYHQPQPQQYSRPPFSRRPSDTLRGKSSTQPVNPSRLTRSLWTAEQRA